MSDWEELRRLSDAATPGPWLDVDGGIEAYVGGNSWTILRSDDEEWLAPDYATRAFIVAAVNYVRAALSGSTAPLDVERLARALHGTGMDLSAEPWTWGSCTNWEPGWGDECGPDKHMDEARNLLRRLASSPDPTP
jgi:hypothetical protein